VRVCRRRAVSALRALPLPARLALLPLTGGVEAAATLANAAAPLFQPTEADRKLLSALGRISNTMAPAGGASTVDAQALLKQLPRGDLSALATTDNAATAALIARRFTATLLERSAARAAPLADAGANTTPERAITAATARIIAESAKRASQALRPARHEGKD
jgi:hypothetical protein